MSPDASSIDRLHDLVAPPPTPWWPPAPGWYWVIGFAVAAAIVLALRAFIRWQHNRYRREALAELASYETALTDPAQRTVALASIAELLKRTALTAWPRAEVAALTGAPWLDFLVRTGGEAKFEPAAGELLEAGAYDARRAGELDEAALRRAAESVRGWLRHHRVEMKKGGAESC